MPSDVFHSGNRDGYGRSPRVLQQIASEGKRALRLDKSCLHSLLILQHEIIEEEEGDEPPTKVKGFIQHISAHPFYTIFYNEAGVRLYHCMASKGLVHCDATGSIVASNKGSAWWCHELGAKRLPYSGKFSPGKIFAKARREVLRKKFARFIFAHAHRFRFHLTRS